MTPDALLQVDEKSTAAPLSKKRCVRFYFYHALFSLAFLLLIVVLIPRWFPLVGEKLFPYVRKDQVEKLQSQLHSLTLALSDLKPKDLDMLNERLSALEEKLQKSLVSSAERPQAQLPVNLERSYFMEALLLCQEIEGRLLAAQDYQAPLSLLAALLKTPEEQAWLKILSTETPATTELTKELTSNWPSWLKPLQNFFTIQPLTDKMPTEHADKRIALQKLKNVVIANYQKASLAASGQESKS